MLRCWLGWALREERIHDVLHVLRERQWVLACHVLEKGDAGPRLEQTDGPKVFRFGDLLRE